MKPVVVLLISCMLGVCLIIYYDSYKDYITLNLNCESQQSSSSGGITIQEWVKRSVKQDDPRVLDYILTNKILLPPTPDDVPYNLETSDVDPSMGQSKVIKRLFKEKEGGFFVECGALDGETRSNTLSLERDYKWKGLLVEGDPSNYEQVLTKKRKAWTAGCCLATHPYPHQVYFKPQFNVGKIVKDAGPEDRFSGANKAVVAVQCVPIYTLLKAINVTSVDYFSLDVEGNELDVLKTIPFHLIDIKTLSVEFFHGPTGADGLEEFMRSKNYVVVDKITHPNNLANDLIFVRADLVTQLDV